MQELTLHLIRHGKTAGNLRKAFVGSMDQPVTPEGKQELLALAAQGVYSSVEAVFASPLRRCIDTAQLLYPEQKIVTVDGLRERHFGDFEGKNHEEIIAIQGYENWGMDADSMEFPAGEGMEVFFSRVSDAFWSVARQCAERSIAEAALVIHGGVIMAVMHLFAIPARGYYDWMCGNGRGYRISLNPHARGRGVVLQSTIS